MLVKTWLHGFGAATLCLCSAALWVATPRAVAPAVAASQQPYHLIQQTTLTGTERWITHPR